MGLLPTERAFPRGGYKEASKQTTAKDSRARKNVNSKTSLFGKRSAPKRQSEAAFDGTDLFPKEKKEKTPFYRLKQYSGQLTYNTVSEGMLVLGSIYKIEDFQLRVVLPGNVLGLVPITNISEPYTVALRSVMLDNDNNSVYQLRDMFKVGQYIVTRVVSKVKEDVRNIITLSLVPEVIYSDITYEDIHKGSVLQAVVKSVEEKGYVMEFGVKSTRAFLLKDKSIVYEEMWHDGRPLRIGQLVPCVVTKSTTDDKFTTVILSAIPDSVAKASADSSGATLETLIPGMQFSVTISRKFPTGIQVQLSNNFVGYVHQDHFPKSFKTSDNYEIGTVTTARVLYILESGAVYFTMKSSILDAKPRPSPYDAVKLGAVIKKAAVVRITDTGLTVNVGKHNNESLKGFIPLSQLARKPQTDEEKFDTPLTEQLMTQYPIGSSVACRVMNYNFMDQYYSCTMDESLMSEKFIHPDMLELGQVIPCFIKSMQLKGIVVSLGKKTRVTGFVPLLHISDVPLTHPEKKFKVGQPVTAKVMSLKDGKTLLTMKPTLVKSREPMLMRLNDASVGDTYEGTVLQVTPKGLLVQFYDLITGWVPPHLLASKRMAEAQILSNFYVGQLVKCTIAKKDEVNQKLVLSLLEGRPTANANDNESLNNGQEGVVKKRRESESNDDQSETKSKKKKKKKRKAEVEEQDEEESPSQKKQKAKRKMEAEPVIVAETEKETKKKKKKKNSYTEENSLEESFTIPENVSENGVKSKKKRISEDSGSYAELCNGGKSKKKKNEVLEEAVKETKKKKKKNKSSESNGLDIENPLNFEKVTENGVKSKKKNRQEDEGVAGDKSKKKKNKSVVETDVKPVVELPRLSLTSGFVWDATPDKLPVVSANAADSDTSSDESSSDSKPVKRSRQAAQAEKRAQAQQEEARLREIERRLMDDDQPPQSADEFDRLVLSSPDSSMVWLQYMAHHLQATEIEKARNVAQRALKTISFREEQEKLNVWMALLNLENMYGTKDSVEEALEEAVRVNDAYQVYTRMLQVYSESNKLQEGDRLVGILTKKFKDHKDMWVNAGTFYMKSAQMEKARALLQRALNGLQQKEHIAMICRFAQLENKLGCAVRAQTLMEQVLTSYPGRVDVWSSYVDMLVKSGSVAEARQVLERATVQKLSSHKMKSLFKKFLAFEEAHGDEESATRVRQLALEYVESAGGMG